MNKGEQAAVRSAAITAARIAALSHYLAEALVDDPSTANQGIAVSGIVADVQRLSDNLHALAELSDGEAA